MLYHQSLQSGVFPEVWKQDRIVAVHKKGRKDDVKNYRPVAILSKVSKVFESLLHPFLLRHVIQYLTENQHGLVICL